VRAEGRAPVGLVAAGTHELEGRGGHQHPRGVRLRLAEDGHADAHAFASERFARIRAELADRVRRNQAAGTIRPDVDPETVASLVIAASDGLQTQWMLDPAVGHTAALELLDRLLAPTRAD